MFKGILLAITACFIWGIIFVVPQYMEGFNSLEICLGRYLFYGLFSLLFFLKQKAKHRLAYPRFVWKKALLLSLSISFGYYIFVILSLRYSYPTVTALILGVSPISIALYGNWRRKEVSFKSLIFPSLLILVGLCLLNIPHLQKSGSPLIYSLGILSALWAVGIWSWYAVSNAQFLKEQPYIKSSDWATLIGVCTLVWVTLFLVAALPFTSAATFDKYLHWTPELRNFLGGSALLGILASWCAGILWNRASFYLPISLAGQLLIFETIFGILFFCFSKNVLPPKHECIGILLLLVAITYAIKSSSKALPSSH